MKTLKEHCSTLVNLAKKIETVENDCQINNAEQLNLIQTRIRSIYSERPSFDAIPSPPAKHFTDSTAEQTSSDYREILTTHLNDLIKTRKKLDAVNKSIENFKNKYWQVFHDGYHENDDKQIKMCNKILTELKELESHLQEAITNTRKNISKLHFDEVAPVRPGTITIRFWHTSANQQILGFSSEGHLSIEICLSEQQRLYISLFPLENGKIIKFASSNIAQLAKKIGPAPHTREGILNSLKGDLKDLSSNQYTHDEEIIFNCNQSPALDINAIYKWADQLLQNHVTSKDNLEQKSAYYGYNFYNKYSGDNCSSIVLKGLQIAGSNNYAEIPSSIITIHPKLSFYTPSMVFKYAKAVHFKLKSQALEARIRDGNPYTNQRDFFYDLFTLKQNQVLAILYTLEVKNHKKMSSTATPETTARDSNATDLEIQALKEIEKILAKYAVQIQKNDNDLSKILDDAEIELNNYIDNLQEKLPQEIIEKVGEEVYRYLFDLRKNLPHYLQIYLETLVENAKFQLSQAILTNFNENSDRLVKQKTDREILLDSIGLNNFYKTETADKGKEISADDLIADYNKGGEGEGEEEKVTKNPSLATALKIIKSFKDATEFKPFSSTEAQYSIFEKSLAVKENIQNIINLRKETIGTDSKRLCDNVIDTLQSFQANLTQLLYFDLKATGIHDDSKNLLSPLQGVLMSSAENFSSVNEFIIAYKETFHRTIDTNNSIFSYFFNFGSKDEDRFSHNIYTILTNETKKPEQKAADIRALAASAKPSKMAIWNKKKRKRYEEMEYKARILCVVESFIGGELNEQEFYYHLSKFTQLIPENQREMLQSFMKRFKDYYKENEELLVEHESNFSYYVRHHNGLKSKNESYQTIAIRLKDMFPETAGKPPASHKDIKGGKLMQLYDQVKSYTEYADKIQTPLLQNDSKGKQKITKDDIEEKLELVSDLIDTDINVLNSLRR